MIADTAVITKPSTSRVINSSLCLKLTTGGLGITFFDTCFVERARGLRTGFASGLTFAGLRGVLYVVAIVGFCGASSRFSLRARDLVPMAARRIAENVRTVFSLREHEAMRAAERVDLARKYSLPRMKALVGDASIDVFGAEQAFVFLNDMNWHPRPLFQGFCWVPLVGRLPIIFHEKKSLFTVTS